MSQSALRIRSELMLGPLAGWLLMALLAPGAAAQTVPADIAEVSIEDLFASNVVTREERARTSKRWHLSYLYLRSDYDEYRSGTRRLSYDDALWNGPTEPRTDQNYPVVPTRSARRSIHCWPPTIFPPACRSICRCHLLSRAPITSPLSPTTMNSISVPTASVMSLRWLIMSSATR